MHRERTMGLVSVIVVNTNDLRYLEGCFSSLLNSAYPRLEIVMFDNRSTDGSVEFVRSRFPEVKIVENRRNYGFPVSCNRALPHTSGEFVFLLNPDTVADPSCVPLLVEGMESAPKVGICGAKMLMGWEPELINSIGHNVNRIFWGWDRGCFEWDRGQYDEVCEVPSVCGGAALYRASLFHELGLFDTRFFMYSEDVDFGLRANLAGYRVLVVPSARVRHRLNLKVGDPRHHQFFEHKNRLRILLKNAPAEMLLSSLQGSIRYDLSCIRELRRSGRRTDASWRVRALLWNLRRLPDTLLQRARIQRSRRVPPERIRSLLDPGTGLPFFPSPLPDHDFLTDDNLDPARLRSGFRVGESENGHIGLGWYQREPFGGETVRWTGDYAYFYLSGASGADTVEVRGVNPHGLNVKWSVNGSPAGRVMETEDGFFLGVPKGAPVVKVALKIENPVGDASVPYWRPRGIAVSAVRSVYRGSVSGAP